MIVAITKTEVTCLMVYATNLECMNWSAFCLHK